jgi:hypothetical protein
MTWSARKTASPSRRQSFPIFRMKSLHSRVLHLVVGDRAPLLVQCADFWAPSPVLETRYTKEGR